MRALGLVVALACSRPPRRRSRTGWLIAGVFVLGLGLGLRGTL